MTKGTNDSEEIKKNVHDSKMKYQFHSYISYIAVQLDSVDIPKDYIIVYDKSGIFNLWTETQFWIKRIFKTGSDKIQKSQKKR